MAALLPNEYNRAELAAIAAIKRGAPLQTRAESTAVPPGVSYRPLNACKETAVHFGQRKLFVGELGFFARNLRSTDEVALVVYAGAAPGQHLPELARLFPGLRFVLYDPVPFSAELRRRPEFELHQKYFTDADAAEWNGRADFFISDIRCAVSVADEVEEPAARAARMSTNEAKISEDMALQQGWVRLVRPRRASWLKMRLPFNDPAVTVPLRVKYLAGAVHWQPWAPPSSTEVRLEVPAAGGAPGAPGDYATQEYDAVAHENRAYYYNKFLREYARYANPALARSLSHDEALEYTLWLAYFALPGPKPFPSVVRAVEQTTPSPGQKIALTARGVTHRCKLPLQPTPRQERWLAAQSRPPRGRYAHGSSSGAHAR